MAGKGKIDADDVDAVLGHLELGGKKKKVLPQKLFVYSSLPKQRGDIIPFGIKALDEATGIGGHMRGKILELFGPESGGKSYLTLKLMSQAQRLYPDVRVGLVDIEHSFDPVWAESHGVDAGSIVYGSDFECGEDAMDNMIALVNSKLCSLVVLDSTAALIPRAELEASLNDHKMAELGRLMSRGVKQIMDAAEKTNTAVVFVNQIRSKVGVMFGDPETTPGGRALKFYSHMRIKVQRIGLEKSKTSEDLAGIVSKAKIVKNKLAVPFKTAEFVLYFKPEGNHPIVKMLKQAHDVKLIRKKTDKDSNAVCFVRGKGVEAVEYLGADFTVVGDSLVKMGKDSVLEFLAALEKKAADEGVELLPEVLALKTAEEISSPMTAKADPDTVFEKGDGPSDEDGEVVEDES